MFVTFVRHLNSKREEVGGKENLRAFEKKKGEKLKLINVLLEIKLIFACIDWHVQNTRENAVVVEGEEEVERGERRKVGKHKKKINN